MKPFYTSLNDCPIKEDMGRGGGQVVSMFAFCSDDPSSNPAEVYNFSVQIVVKKNKNKQKDAAVGPFLFLKN